MTQTTTTRCLTCTRNDLHACGLCPRCYQAATRAIRLGQITRRQAERRRLILPPRPRRSAWSATANH